ncbi:MAG: phosphoribosylglycinamide formyltransferase [Neisseria zoodegmatis]|uniref:phosphoribosylglycinamide formyltransferase n=1 Tax=Neisseria zoodegmatis TaxID=326523 RepID=UPI0026EB72C8|nr:phosphoribosylglycinamide formyltransferase [Neisseria zoodegmatis]MDO5070560.1 phosphoribosylglycinamide formyltransferase [Neisseria zoodegmatis]
MKKFSTNAKINNLVVSLLGLGWKVKKRKKHNILIAPNNRRVAIPSTPSDCRAFWSFSCQIKSLCPAVMRED